MCPNGMTPTSGEIAGGGVDARLTRRIEAIQRRLDNTVGPRLTALEKNVADHEHRLSKQEPLTLFGADGPFTTYVKRTAAEIAGAGEPMTATELLKHEPSEPLSMLREVVGAWTWEPDDNDLNIGRGVLTAVADRLERELKERLVTYPDTAWESTTNARNNGQRATIKRLRIEAAEEEGS